MTQNTRQLPVWVESSGGVLKLGSIYDANGNVASVEDQATAGHQSRSMQYDDLDRLTQASSSMFGTDNVATYTYDTLDNLTRTKVAGRDTYYCYHPSNRTLLQFLRTGPDCAASPAAVTLAFDVQGNLAGKNAATYSFDIGNRLREVSTSGTATERYRYDAPVRHPGDRRAIGPLALRLPIAGRGCGQRNALTTYQIRILPTLPAW